MTHTGRVNRAATTTIAIKCRTCSTMFAITEAQKEACYLRGYHPPRRCPACRAFARAERAADVTGPTVARGPARTGSTTTPGGCPGPSSACEGEGQRDRRCTSSCLTYTSGG